MTEKIYHIINALLGKIDGGYLFIGFLGLELALFVVVFFICLFRQVGKAKLNWYFSLSLALLFIELAFMSIESALELFYLSLGITLIFFSIIIVLISIDKKERNSHRDLAKFIDQSVKMANAQDKITENAQQSFCSDIDNSQEESVEKFELDFQHVKLVIQKLEYYPLSSSDKKVVRDLEDSIYQAQTYGFTSILKNKINDGLGALLKIMSKHGV